MSDTSTVSILSSLPALLLSFFCTLHAQEITWQPTSGPYGGAVGALMTSESGTVFAGTGHGLYRSDDEGRRWRIAGLESERVNALARDSAGALFAGTESGLWSSPDDGNTWVLVGFGDTSVLTVAVQSNGWLFVGTSVTSSTQTGLFRSVDDGTHWEQIEPGEYGMGEVIRIDVLNDSLVFVAGVGELTRSGDNGETWCSMYHVIYLSEHSDGSAFRKCCGIYSFLPFADGDSVLVSDLYGLGIVGGCESREDQHLWESGQDVYTLYRDSDGAFLAGTKDRGLFRSTDNGWTWVAYGPSTIQVNAIAESKSGELIVGTSVDGIVRSLQGRGLWEVSADGMPLIRTTHVTGLQSDIAIAGTTTGLFRTSNGGDSWHRVLFDGLETTVLTRETNGDLYAGITGSGVIARSTDDGETWGFIEVARSGGVRSILPAGDRVLVAARGEIIEISGAPTSDFYELPPKLYRSTDGGVSWHIVFQGVDIWSMVRTSDGSFLALAKGLLRSTDRGATWKPLATTPDTVARRLFALPDGSVCAVFSGDTLWRSDDNGNTWNPFGLGLPGLPGRLLLNGEGTFFAIVSGDLYRSTDGGTAWEEIDDQPPGPILALDNDGYLYAGGPYQPVYRSVRSTVSVAEVVGKKGFRLHPNTPDPFSERTTVRYSLPGRTHIRLTLIDALSREVRVLQEGEMEGGEHRVEVEGENLAQGVYFVRLVVDDGAMVESILLRR